MVDITIQLANNWWKPHGSISESEITCSHRTFTKHFRYMIDHLILTCLAVTAAQKHYMYWLSSLIDWLAMCLIINIHFNVHVWQLFPRWSTNGHPILCNDWSNHAMSRHFKFLISYSASIFVATHINCTQRYRFLLQASDMFADIYLS